MYTAVCIYLDSRGAPRPRGLMAMSARQCLQLMPRGRCSAAVSSPGVPMEGNGASKGAWQAGEAGHCRRCLGDLVVLISWHTTSKSFEARGDGAGRNFIVGTSPRIAGCFGSWLQWPRKQVHLLSKSASYLTLSEGPPAGMMRDARTS